VDVSFTAEVFEWRGPAPFYFVAVPEPEVEELRDVQRLVTYGWGMVPAQVRIGDTGWTTSLWPRAGGFVVPLKGAIRRAERIHEGDIVEVTLTIDDTPSL